MSSQPLSTDRPKFLNPFTGKMIFDTRQNREKVEKLREKRAAAQLDPRQTKLDPHLKKLPDV
jgi:hypothetical protein